jgi:hypothetical protein
LPPAPAPTTATTAVSYAVPAQIDAVYVGRVIQALDHVYGDAIRIMVRDRAVDEPFLKHLLAIYTDRFFRLAQDAWVKDVSRGLPGLPGSPGDAITTVQRLLRAEPVCVVAAVSRDYSPSRTDPTPDPQQHYAALIPKPADRDPGGLNPTPWILTYDGFTQDGSAPEDPCRPV